MTPPIPTTIGIGNTIIEANSIDNMVAAPSIIKEGFQSYLAAKIINGTASNSIVITDNTGIKIDTNNNTIYIAVSSVPSVNCLDLFIQYAPHALKKFIII